MTEEERDPERWGTFERVWLGLNLLVGLYSLATWLPNPLALFIALSCVWVAVVPHKLKGPRIMWLGEGLRLLLWGYPLWLSCMWAGSTFEALGIRIPALGSWSASAVAGWIAAGLWLAVLIAIRVHLYRRWRREQPPEPETIAQPEEAKAKAKSLGSGSQADSEPVRDWGPEGPEGPELGQGASPESERLPENPRS